MFEGALFGTRGRSLPVYLLLDCSASMQGEPIVALRDGVQALYNELMSDPEARSKVKLSVITYSDQVYQTDLVPIDVFTPPLIAAGSTRPQQRRPFWVRLFRSRSSAIQPSYSRLDVALNLLIHSIESDVRLNTSSVKGDYRPLVFLFTAGKTTDGSGKPSTAYRSEMIKLWGLRPTLVAFGCGPDADMSVLRDITDNALLVRDISGYTLRQFVRFISISIKGGSQASLPASESHILPPPPGILYYPSDDDDATPPPSTGITFRM